MSLPFIYNGFGGDSAGGGGGGMGGSGGGRGCNPCCGSCVPGNTYTPLPTPGPDVCLLCNSFLCFCIAEDTEVPLEERQQTSLSPCIG